MVRGDRGWGQRYQVVINKRGWVKGGQVACERYVLLEFCAASCLNSS